MNAKTSLLALLSATLAAQGCMVTTPETYVLGLVTTRELNLPVRTLGRVEAEDCGEGDRENGDLGNATAAALAAVPPAQLMLDARVTLIGEGKVTFGGIPTEWHACIHVEAEAAELE